MQTKDIRLIAMDMDGTLLNSHQQISPRNALALRRAAEMGVHLAICSGRAPADIGLFARENGLDDCALLGLNGTSSWLSPKGEVLADHVMEPQTLQETFRILWDANVIFTCFSQNHLVVFRDPQRKTDHMWLAHEGAGLTLVHSETGMESLQGKGVNKIIAMFPSVEQVAAVRTELEAVPGLGISSSWIDNLELMPEGCDKGTAVAELAAHFGLGASEVMTFGDFDNDLPMIRWAGWGTAMGNANESVKSAAKLITRTNDEDGIAWAIEKYVLKDSL